MGVVLEPLILENILEKVFSFLPDMSFDEDGAEYPVTFGYGDKIELNTFLANREESNVYPLIWMLYPLEEDHQKLRLVANDVSFILAVTTNQTMENAERIKLTYGRVLMPLLYNIRLLFRQSNVVSVGSKTESYKVVKHPNFSESEARDKAGTIAIWDALKITVNLEVIQGCIKPVKFF